MKETKKKSIKKPLQMFKDKRNYYNTFTKKKILIILQLTLSLTLKEAIIIIKLPTLDHKRIIRILVQTVSSKIKTKMKILKVGDSFNTPIHALKIGKNKSIYSFSPWRKRL